MDKIGGKEYENWFEIIDEGRNGVYMVRTKISVDRTKQEVQYAFDQDLSPCIPRWKDQVRRNVLRLYGKWRNNWAGLTYGRALVTQCCKLLRFKENIEEEKYKTVKIQKGASWKLYENARDSASTKSSVKKMTTTQNRMQHKSERKDAKASSQKFRRRDI